MQALTFLAALLLSALLCSWTEALTVPCVFGLAILAEGFAHRGAEVRR
jgi:hypothetical protein